MCRVQYTKGPHLCSHWYRPLLAAHEWGPLLPLAISVGSGNDTELGSRGLTDPGIWPYAHPSVSQSLANPVNDNRGRYSFPGNLKASGGESKVWESESCICCRLAVILGAAKSHSRCN